jgi:hypothetical protein
MIGIVALVVLTAVLAVLYLHNHKVVRQAEAAFPPTGQFIPVEDVKMHYVSNGKGRPVIFLHGGIG